MCGRFAPGAWRYALPPAAAGLVLLPFSLPASVVAVALAAAVLAFHRDPDRTVPAGGIVAPADGRVSVIRDEAGRLRVGVFMNLHDVHVNRAPLPGRVEDVTHTEGGHWPAFSKESDRNERVRIICEGHEVVLIAGAVARRIHPYVSAGDAVERGERIAHISFGSRVDVCMPPDVRRADLAVSKGDRVRAGETLLVPDAE